MSWGGDSWQLPDGATADVYPHSWHGPGSDQEEGHDFIPSTVTVNATGWGTLKKFRGRTQAHAVCAQELQLRRGACDEASQWAWRHGWKSLFPPSVCSDGGGLSA